MGVTATIGVLNHTQANVHRLAAGHGSARASGAASADVSPVGEMAVFSAPANPSDALPAALARGAGALVDGTDGISDALLPGALNLSNSRRLLSGRGSESLDLYAFPTSKGQVCYVTTAPSAACVASFEDDPGSVAWEIADSAPAQGSLPMLYGLVPDRVTALAVRAGSVTTKVAVSRNAYFFESPAADVWPSALIVTYSDGSTVTVDLPPPPVRQIATPASGA